MAELQMEEGQMMDDRWALRNNAQQEEASGSSSSEEEEEDTPGEHTVRRPRPVKAQPVPRVSERHSAYFRIHNRKRNRVSQTSSRINQARDSQLRKYQLDESKKAKSENGMVTTLRLATRDNERLKYEQQKMVKFNEKILADRKLGPFPIQTGHRLPVLIDEKPPTRSPSPLLCPEDIVPQHVRPVGSPYGRLAN